MGKIDLLKGVPGWLPEEEITPLVETGGFRLERIISTGHASPEGFWYDQDRTEWVLLLQGRAALVFEGQEEAVVLQPGECVEIPAHVRHRVLWTDPGIATVWLALHYA